MANVSDLKAFLEAYKVFNFVFSKTVLIIRFTFSHFLTEITKKIHQKTGTYFKFNNVFSEQHFRKAYFWSNRHNNYYDSLYIRLNFS